MRLELQQVLAELEREREAQEQPPPGERFHPRPGLGDLDDKMLAVGPETARLLNTFIRATRAQRVLEIGGSLGYSTLWMAEALEATGGRLLTTEYIPAKAAALRRRIAAAGVATTVELHEGDALRLLPQLDGPWDLVLVDAWKDDYPTYFELVFPRLRVGGLIVADNITYPLPPGEGIEAYLRKAHSHPDAQSQLIPIGSGLELTVRLR
jgi:predicted O-methyltransferase YrrM